MDSRTGSEVKTTMHTAGETPAVLCFLFERTVRICVFGMLPCHKLIANGK